MSDELTTKTTDTALALPTTLGEAANQAAGAGVFASYQAKRAPNTIRRQRAALALFADFLNEHAHQARAAGLAVEWPAGLTGDDLMSEPAAWKGITWGLVAKFQEWQLNRGYAVGTVNIRLSTIRTYAGKATQAGVLSSDELTMIRGVQGNSKGDAANIDQNRESVGIPTRVGHKKAEAVVISDEKAERIKEQPDTPQGRRDKLLLCLMLNHGMRVSEVAALRVGDFNLDRGTVTFYRPKRKDWITHELTRETWEAARRYIELDALAVGPLMRTSRKDGRLHDAGMSTRSLTERVRVLAVEAIGQEGMSAHDCRHSLATAKANEWSMRKMMDVFGWASPAMAVRYQEAARVVKLED